ncbi:NAD(P)-binding protein [Thozetella sp. PMI_491]|nr:NAD(P)-binding protein [Thozetella sp. PMI_491]
MCRPCGDFNLAGLRLSLPDSLKLPGRTALVTGARVNLGYYTALRLLRCGARVIVSTRYPNDAAIRYSKETDFLSWQDRLKIVGADFRTARDAFALVRAARLALAEWNVEALDILVNNAAQTLTDSLKKEQRAIFLEQQGQEQATGTGLLFYPEGPTSYQPRIRGGVTPLTLEAAPETKALSFGEEPEDTLVLPDGVKDDGRTEMESDFKSSWVQILSEIPYEDVISAHAVNTFVPLILCRELLPLMGALQSDNKESGSGQPLGYIINVSSREGLFELNPNHSAKRGKHVHTNMSKAALNMITQTEAASAWKTRRVAMNSVDPGFMSAAPEIDAMIGGELPIGWEDGAGRLLWPVAIGEVDGKGVWGRFLKHYGATDVDSTLDRG